MSGRFGHESGFDKSLHLDFWLTIGRNLSGGDRPTVRVTANYPELARNERTLNLKMQLPLALYEAPALTASIKVESPDQAVSIDTTAIADAVRGAIGLDVDITVAAPEGAQ